LIDHKNIQIILHYRVYSTNLLRESVGDYLYGNNVEGILAMATAYRYCVFTEKNITHGDNGASSAYRRFRMIDGGEAVINNCCLKGDEVFKNWRDEVSV
jgi:hypothetical protein